MTNKIWFLLFIISGLYGMNQEQKDILKKNFQNEILDDEGWEKYLTPEGIKEFLHCVEKPSDCKIPSIADRLEEQHDSDVYITTTTNFYASLNEALDDFEKLPKILDEHLSKYITNEGRKNFCIPIKKNTFRQGYVYAWLTHKYAILAKSTTTRYKNKY